MDDPTCVGGPNRSGWIPGCPCRRCAEELAAKRRELHPPALRLVRGGDRVPAEGRWADEPLSLRALAVALEHLVGEGPDPYAGFTPELAGWFDRYGRAVEMLAEVANMDAGLLRSLSGPAHDDDGPRAPGAGLLVSAANHAARR